MKLESRFAGRISNGAFPIVVLVAAAFVAAAAGCVPYIGEPPCSPPAYSVNPTDAKPGETVTVTAPEADCNPRYGANALIQVIVTDKSGAPVVNTTSPMTDAGAFSFTFVVPGQMAGGDAAVTAMPHNIDWCDDTGRNNRAGGETVSIERASCAIPVELLNITR